MILKKTGKIVKRLTVLTLILSMILGIGTVSMADEVGIPTLISYESETMVVEREMNELLGYYDSVSDFNDWELICALYGAGYDFSDTFFEDLGWDSDEIKVNSSVSTYGSKILAVLAMGQDPSNIWGRDLISELINRMDEMGSFGTPTDQMYGMMALDAVDADYNVALAIVSLTGMQNEDGGFGYAVGTSDIDSTCVALMAMANHMDDLIVQTSIQRALSYIKGQQLATGGFPSWGDENSNTISRVMSGLTAVGEDIFATKWLYDGKSMFDALQAYELEGHNYSWQLDPFEPSGFSSKQVLMAYGDVVSGEQVFQRLAAMNKTITVSIRIEGIYDTIMNDTLTYTYIGDKVSAKIILKEALDANALDYDLMDSSFGVYLSSIDGEVAGTFGGYDGWLYLLNGSSGMGLEYDYINDGDQLVFYYGDFAPGTLVPEVTILNPVLAIGEPLMIHVSATYDTYDANWNPTPVTIDVTGAEVVFNDKTYVTSNKGLVIIEQKDIDFEMSNTYQVLKNNIDGVPSILRTELKNVDITLDASILYKDDSSIASWAYDAVYSAREAGIMLGYNNQLKPKETLTRAQLITMLMKMSDYSIDNYGTEFNDLVENSWYYDYVSTGEYNQVVEGVTDVTFGPDAYVTRAEFAKMITLVYGLVQNDEVINYADIDGLDIATIEAIDAVSEAGLFVGYNGNYMPETYVTREMAAVVMMRLFDME